MGALLIDCALVSPIFHFCCCCSVFICLVTPQNMNWILVLWWRSESSSKKGWKSAQWRTSEGTFQMKVSYVLDERQSCCTTSQNGMKLWRFVPCDPFLIQQGLMICLTGSAPAGLRLVPFYRKYKPHSFRVILLSVSVKLKLKLSCFRWAIFLWM